MVIFFKCTAIKVMLWLWWTGRFDRVRCRRLGPVVDGIWHILNHNRDIFPPHTPTAAIGTRAWHLYCYRVIIGTLHRHCRSLWWLSIELLLWLSSVWLTLPVLLRSTVEIKVHIRRREFCDRIPHRAGWRDEQDSFLTFFKNSNYLPIRCPFLLNECECWLT